jgi:GNAT superfamily N-acetyltransferase
MQLIKPPGRVVIEAGTVEDWRALAKYHYRSARLGPVDRIYRLKTGGRLVCVAVYAFPTLQSSVRNRVFDGRYNGHALARERHALLNREVRTLRRLVTHPDWRRRGLAAMLLRVTLPVLGVPFVECVSVAARRSHFLEDAGFVCCGSVLPRRAALRPFYYLWVGDDNEHQSSGSQKKMKTPMVNI